MTDCTRTNVMELYQNSGMYCLSIMITTFIYATSQAQRFLYPGRAHDGFSLKKRLLPFLEDYLCTRLDFINDTDDLKPLRRISLKLDVSSQNPTSRTVMALQTQTESSFSSSSTSTSASSSSSSATTTNDNPDSGSFFTPTSSPPLILAFLAIGLLVTAIIAALGWRRRRQMGRGQFHKAEMDIGSKPKLWDLRTTSRISGSGSHVTGIDSAAGRGANGMEMCSSGAGKFWSRLHADQEIEISWENIMPISVTPLIHANDDEDRNSDELVQELLPSPTSWISHIVSQSRTVLVSLSHHLPGRIHHHHRQHWVHEGSDAIEPSLSDPPAETDKGRFEAVVDNISRDQYESLQIAVAIAMPMPKVARDKELDGNLGEVDERRPEMYEYALGLCRTSCSGAEGHEFVEVTSKPVLPH
ncbi:uncharacterized protein C8R40DRAFT_1068267 [Lentinula edodes]|uniref:uncharacterized protein n=1 Tax=Lentinula edodes TaxID=5353 RepID=UPI001E8CAD33|nr:uncharacterized protein C8R40DRAFT_1068267 [Lentinula edodes]KAH7877056.1 hypothetical protein C8R40DRAFT_1068267 [Lentinula edodes]